MGASWMKQGWIANSYLTSAPITAVQLFLQDTLGISLTQTATAAVVISTGDTLSIAFSESFNTTYKRHVVASETVNLSFGEQQYSLKRSSVTETLGVSFSSETASKNTGSFTQKSASDTLSVTIDDPGVNQFIEVADSLGVSLSEVSSYRITLARADTLAVSLVEISSPGFAGSFLKSASDSLNVALAETKSTRFFEKKSAVDSLDLSFGENASIAQGIIVVYLQSTDLLNLGVDGIAAVTSQQDVLGLYANDSLSSSLSEATTRVEVFFFSTGDTLSVALLDSSILNKISINLTWEDGNFPWGGASLKEIKALPVFALGSSFYQVDSANLFANDTPVKVVLERLGLTVYGRDRQGNWKEDPDVMKLVKAVYPLFRGEPGTVVNIYVGAQESMEGAVTWDGPHIFVIGQDTFVTPLVSGRFIGIRFESLGQRPWTLLSYDLDITKVGRGL